MRNAINNIRAEIEVIKKRLKYENLSLEETTKLVTKWADGKDAIYVLKNLI